MTSRKRAELLALIPDDARRIRVVDAKGKQRYRLPDEIKDSDDIQTDVNGVPIVMRGSPGRKKGFTPKGTTPQVSGALYRKKVALVSDPLMELLTSNPESPDVLHEVIRGMTEEAVNLKEERNEAARDGKDTLQHSAKRVNALRAIADTWLKRMDQISNKMIDLDSGTFEILYKFLLETFRDSMRAANLRPEQIETVFSRFAATVGNEEWRNEARTRMKKGS